MVKIGTSRINYKGHSGQLVLDTTIKSGKGLGAVFAPTWSMVMASKNNQITWEQYRHQYTELMRQRYTANKPAFLEVLNQDELIVCCYCQDLSGGDQHCHRYLLADILQKIAAHHGIEVELIGEVK
jgi:hypothetical protein